MFVESALKKQMPYMVRCINFPANAKELKDLFINYALLNCFQINVNKENFRKKIIFCSYS